MKQQGNARVVLDLADLAAAQVGVEPQLARFGIHLAQHHGAQGAAEAGMLGRERRQVEIVLRIGRAVTQQMPALAQHRAEARLVLRMPDVEIGQGQATRSEEHTSELQSLMRISYAVFCLKKNNT